MSDWAEMLADTVWIILLVSGVPLIASMLIGVGISILQAATQVQEATITFVPKVLAVFAVLFFVGPFLFEELNEFSISIFENLPSVGSSR